MELLSFAKKPYPFYYAPDKLAKFSLFIFLFTFLFYIFIRPFEINEEEHNLSFWFISLIHALVVVLALALIVLPLQWLKLEEDDWSVGRELGFFTIFLLLVGIGQYLIRDIIYDKPDNWDVQFLWEEVWHTYAVGIVFLVIVIPFNYHRLLVKNEDAASKISLVESVNDPSPIVQIQTKVKSEEFTINPGHFLFAKADGNYLDIYMRTESKVNVLTKRMSINELANQIQGAGRFLQTHRSYLVNLDMVRNVKGNAQGYQLSFDHTEEKALVSRRRIEDFEKLFDE